MVPTISQIPASGAPGAPFNPGQKKSTRTWIFQNCHESLAATDRGQASKAEAQQHQRQRSWLRYISDDVRAANIALAAQEQLLCASVVAEILDVQRQEVATVGRALCRIVQTLVKGGKLGVSRTDVVVNLVAALRVTSFNRAIGRNGGRADVVACAGDLVDAEVSRAGNILAIGRQRVGPGVRAAGAIVAQFKTQIVDGVAGCVNDPRLTPQVNKLVRRASFLVVVKQEHQLVTPQVTLQQVQTDVPTINQVAGKAGAIVRACHRVRGALVARRRQETVVDSTAHWEWIGEIADPVGAGQHDCLVADLPWTGLDWQTVLRLAAQVCGALGQQVERIHTEAVVGCAGRELVGAWQGQFRGAGKTAGEKCACNQRFDRGFVEFHVGTC